MAKEQVATLAPPARTAPVLVAAIGRGGTSKSTLLMEVAQRAQNQGREVIVADGDARSKTLTGLFANATQPESEELSEVKIWLMRLLNDMVRTGRSAVLDLGGGDRSLMDFGREVDIVAFAKQFSIAPMAMYCLGPDAEDLSHVVTLWRSGFFRPERTLLVLNEGIIRNGRSILGAFERTLGNPDFQAILKDGAKYLVVDRLSVMDEVKASGHSLYAAAAGEAGLDPVEQFMCAQWLRKLEEQRIKAGVSNWLP